jgi:hypothetical protein
MEFTLVPENDDMNIISDSEETFLVDADPSQGYTHTRKKHIPCRRELLVSSLQKFYTTLEDFDSVVQTMQGNGPYSLRLIDVFVTNYSKKYNTTYMLNGQEFVVYLNYKSQTKAYSKKLFDPFRRHECILFQAGNHEPFITTVGQLNFFRWAHEKGVLKYIEEHVEDIRREEKESRRQNGSTQNSTASESSVSSSASGVSGASTVSGTSATSTGSRRRRTEKVPAAIKLLHKHDVEITISFD